MQQMLFCILWATYWDTTQPLCFQVRLKFWISGEPGLYSDDFEDVIKLLLCIVCINLHVIHTQMCPSVYLPVTA